MTHFVSRRGAGWTGALALVLASACSTTATSSESRDDALAPPSAACATLDYGHASAPADYYRFFESDAKAGDFVRALLARGVLAGSSGPGATLREISTDEHLLRLVSEVFEGFKRAFPRETAGLEAPPRVAVVES